MRVLEDTHLLHDALDPHVRANEPVDEDLKHLATVVIETYAC
jgi:hypothetical protein